MQESGAECCSRMEFLQQLQVLSKTEGLIELNMKINNTLSAVPLWAF